MSKTIIIPLVAFLALVVKLAFDITIDETTQTNIVEVVSQVIALGLVLEGIFRNHKK